MKLLLAALLFLFSFVPAQAAYDDVSMTTDTVISISDESVNVSGTTAVIESIVVDSSSFNVTLNVGAGGASEITITSAGNKEITPNTSAYTTSDTCSVKTLTGSSVQATITITLGGTCDSQSNRTSSGGGGGGGSNRNNRNNSSASTSATPSAPAVVVSSPVASIGALFTADLEVGATGTDVLRLQKLLASRPDLYPEGTVTGYFGPLSQRAVEKFQIAYGIASPGSVGFGRVGPMTRAKLLEVFGGSAVTGVSTPASSAATPAATVVPATAVTAQTASSLSRQLGKGMSGADVTAVQKILNSNVETKIAEAGPGSPGNETDLFGSLTEMAVQKFQVKYGIAAPGDSGYGWVGPKTLAKLKELGL